MGFLTLMKLFSISILFRQHWLVIVTVPLIVVVYPLIMHFAADVMTARVFDQTSFYKVGINDVVVTHLTWAAQREFCAWTYVIMFFEVVWFVFAPKLAHTFAFFVC